MNQIILFDGVCNLCNASVNFIIAHDSKKKFQFASLQSEFAQKLISNPSNNHFLYSSSGLIKLNDEIRKNLMSLNSIIYLDETIFYTKSDAALRISKDLNGFIRYVSVGQILPVGFRDSIYEWIAINRYNWFGKSDSCRVLSPDLRTRFLK